MEVDKNEILDNNSYIELLINHTFSILPTYEEHGKCELIVQKIENLIHRLKGFFSMNDFPLEITMDILSFMNALKDLDEHKAIRCCVLKTCSLLSQLKVVDN